MSATERMIALMDLHTCPVCGWTALLDRPRSSDGGGSHEICPSCSFEFGYTDDDLGYTFAEWRRKWVSEGRPWCGVDEPVPDGWDPVEQSRGLGGA